MKWKTIPHGSLRINQRFAYFPVELNDGHTIWLEKYYVVERWVCDYDGCWWDREYKTQDKDEANRILKCLNP